MSQNASQPQAPQVPDEAAAHRHVMASVYDPVFAQELRKRGHAVDTHEQLEAAKDLCRLGRQQGLDRVLKEAAAADDPILLARAQLMAKAGGASSAEESAALKEAADLVIADPNNYAALLGLKLAQLDRTTKAHAAA